MARRRPAIPAPRLGIRLGVLAASAALAAGRAQAQGPGEWVAGPAVGAAVLSDGDGRHPGILLGADGRYGLGEAWGLRGGLEAAFHPAGAGKVQMGTGSLGLVTTWDVLRLVPFADAGIALVWLDRTGQNGAGFLGGQVTGGVSYLIDRRWAVAGGLRLSHLGLALGGGSDLVDAPWLLAALLRLEHHF